MQNMKEILWVKKNKENVIRTWHAHDERVKKM